jgi:hypothetical protein
MLQDYGCRETIVIQPTERSKKKTDRRGAGSLSEITGLLPVSLGWGYGFFLQAARGIVPAIYFEYIR